MKQYLVSYILSSVLIVTAVGTAYAQKDSVVSDTAKTIIIDKEYYQVKDGVRVTDPYSLEALLNMNVSVASKKEERVSEAPGSVTAYSDKDIARTGYYTLSDLANITVGYSAFSAIGEKTFETRGQKSDGFDNNKHLVLIDGIPFSHTRANRANSEED